MLSSQQANVLGRPSKSSEVYQTISKNLERHIHSFIHSSNNGWMAALCLTRCKALELQGEQDQVPTVRKVMFTKQDWKKKFKGKQQTSD